VAKSGNPDLNIATLDWEGAKRVYFRRYWLAAHCDELASRIAVLHFDGAVNHNPSRAGIFLQRAVGVEADGDIGPATLAAVAAKDAIVVCNLICDQRAKFYNDIVAKKPDQVRFLKGWLRRIDEMRAFTTDPTRTFA
jgi:lysozyme family protein